MVNTGKEKDKTAMEKQRKNTQTSGAKRAGASSPSAMPELTSAQAKRLAEARAVRAYQAKLNAEKSENRAIAKPGSKNPTIVKSETIKSEAIKTENDQSEMAKSEKSQTKRDTKSPKRSVRSLFQKKDQKMNLYSSLVYRSRAKKEARARKEAEELSKLPKEPVKRFFSRLHPRRVFHFIFSKKGLFFFLKASAVMFLLAVIAIGGLFLYYKKDLDEIRLDQMKVSGTVNTYLDRNGQILWEDRGDGDYRLVVEGENISTYMRQATVAIEDREFYNHPGVNFFALIRASLSTLSGHGVQGGSTLTQQLIKQVYFSDEASNRTVTGLPRKIKEMILALELEKMYSKEQIITMYLNESPYGGRRNGVESAAQAYFKKSAKDLTLAESALLASIPNNPSYLSPYNTAANKALIARQQKTLDVMEKMGYITAEQAEEAKKVNILDEIQPEVSRYTNIKAPHFVLEVKKQLEAKYGVKTMRAGGFTIKTSLDLRAQEYAEAAVANGVKLMRTNGSDNISLSSVDVETGQVIAMVGSADWNKPVYGEVNAATALLEPGSTIKPILDYAPLFAQREGVNYGAGSILKDENIDKYYCAGFTGACQLRNYTGAFYGSIPIRKALANSLNIPAVKALYINGIENSLKVAHDLGDLSYCTDTSGGLSVAIGSGCNVRPIEHANAYASIARGGVYKPLTYILEVKNSSGDVVEKWEDTAGKRVLDAQAAYMITDILGDANARNLVWGSLARSAGFVVPGVWTASKTGTTTTSNSAITKDSLMASYSSAIATIVWNGNHDGSGLWNSSNTIVRTVVNDYMGPVHTKVYAAEGKWKPGDKPVQPAGMQTLTVNGITDIWPSWFNSKNNGMQKESIKFNKFTKKKATDCTLSSLVVEVEISYTIDPISKNKAYATDPNGYDPNTEDDCSYTPPSVSFNTHSITASGALKFTVTPGSAGLSRYTLSVDGTVVKSGSVSSGLNDPNYSFTGSESTITVTVTDSQGYEATDTITGP